MNKKAQQENIMRIILWIAVFIILSTAVYFLINSLIA